MSYFHAGAQQFLQDLAANNDKPWFLANKARFEADLQTPALTFLEDANQWFEMAGLPYHGEPKKSGGGLSRIYRDARFSQDKTPYHTHLTLFWGHREGNKTRLMPGIGMRIRPDEVGLGGGIYGGATAELNRVRDAIVRDLDGWDQATSGLDVWGEQLKSAPRGYDKAHPRIDAIRRKQFMVRVPVGAAFTGDLMTTFQEAAVQMQPFLEFVGDALR
ncbi:MAG: TIGR02453 family protein [Thermoplasmatota archaeon]